jgi:uncharacterized protein YigA (DUF484 family)
MIAQKTTDIQKIRQQIKRDRQHISHLENMIRELSKNISNNEKMLESICDHQWKITRDRYDDHSKKTCHICGLEKY